MTLEIPAIGSLWEHNQTKTYYVVYDITNRESTRPNKFPISVSYRQVSDNSTWSRPLTEWVKYYRELRFSPLRKAPYPGDAVWYPTPFGINRTFYSGSDEHWTALENGMLFASEKEAQEVYDAIYQPWRELVK